MALVTTPDNIMCVYIISITLGYFSSIFIVIMSGPRSDIILTPLGGASLSPIYSVALHIFVRSFHSTQQNLLYISDTKFLRSLSSYLADFLFQGRSSKGQAQIFMPCEKAPYVNIGPHLMGIVLDSSTS